MLDGLLWFGGAFAAFVLVACMMAGLAYLGVNLLRTSERESLSTIRDESCEVRTPEQSWEKGTLYGRASSLSDIFDVLPGAVRGLSQSQAAPRPRRERSSLPGASPAG